MRKREILRVPIGLACIPGFVVVALCCGSDRSRSERFEHKQRQRHSDPPEALSSRRRALTPTLEESRSKKAPSHHQQQQSLFFTKLPLDVRYLIYQHVLRGSDGAYVHVASTHQRVCSFSCFDSHDEFHGWQHDCWWDAATDGTTVPRSERREPHQNMVSGLLCCCKQVYSEAIDLLYTTNTLNVRQTRTIVEMKKCMLPRRFQMIRSLEIDAPVRTLWEGSSINDGYNAGWPDNVLGFWRPAWSVISEMHGLLNLRVILSCSRQKQEVDWDTLKYILEPMMGIKHVPEFALEIFLPLPDQLLENVLESLSGDPPFSVKSRGHVHIPNAPPW